MIELCAEPHGVDPEIASLVSLDPPNRARPTPVAACELRVWSWASAQGMGGRVESGDRQWVCCQRVVVVCGRAGPRRDGQASIGSARSRSSAVVKVAAHGHRAGSRRAGRPLRLTSRPGSARTRVRRVRVTVSCSSGWTPPRRRASGPDCGRAPQTRARRRRDVPGDDGQPGRRGVRRSPREPAGHRRHGLRRDVRRRRAPRGRHRARAHTSHLVTLVVSHGTRRDHLARSRRRRPPVPSPGTPRLRRPCW